METQTQYRDVKTAVATVFQSASLPERAIFCKEGEYWAIGYAGKSFRLKDTKGLGYLAHLLRHPAAEFHVLDLAGGVAGQREAGETSQSGHGLSRADEDLEKAGIHIGSLGDAGEMLDDQAKVAYRRRLSELREELEEAKELGNVDRAEQAEQEIDALTSELSRAVGLGGRNRRAASASERARQSIGKTIKSVVERIAQSDASAWGDLLALHQDRHLLLLPARPRFPDCVGIQCDNYRPGRASNLKRRVRSSAYRSSAGRRVLEISPFSFAERTAFAGREAELSTIRAAIDRALTGHGSVVMLAGGPGVGKSRLAMEMAEYASRVGFRYLVGHCYERDELVPFLPFAEIIEGNLAEAPGLDDFRRRMGENAAELAQIAPSLRRVFPIFRNHWNCRRRRSVVIFSRAFPTRWVARLEPVRTCT